MKFAGANSAPHLAAQDELPGRSNYFIGRDPAKWTTDVPQFARVKYEDLYPGIDLVFYGTERQLECDFVIAPGAEYDKIILDFQGAESLAVDTQGYLLVHSANGIFRLGRPRIYQLQSGIKKYIDGGYSLRGNNRVAFRMADPYDRTAPLVIDPVLTYSTYLGGSSEDGAWGVAVDASGNAFVTGGTDSLDFPTTVGSFKPSAVYPSAFVTKINAAGTALVYSTYLGGNNGSGATHIAVDSAGNAFVLGATTSTDFPVTQGAFQPSPHPCTPSPTNHCSDAFVTKLNAAGNALVYSSYLGGSDDEPDENFGWQGGIALDSAGCAHVAWTTASNDFPTTPGSLKPVKTSTYCTAFVAKLNPTGTALVYSTYLGGRYFEQAHDIAVDSSGNAYVTGSTGSADFPRINAYPIGADWGAFVSKLNPSGTGLLYSTVLPAGASYAIAADDSGNAWVAVEGREDYPTTPGAFRPGGQGGIFVTKLNTNASGVASMVFSTRLAYGAAFAIEVDTAGNAYTAGHTLDDQFPMVNPIQATIGYCDESDPACDYGDAFVAVLNSTGSALLFSTFLGSSNHWETAYDIAVGPGGTITVVGDTGGATDFPTAHPYQPVAGGQGDAFITEISPVSCAYAILPADRTVGAGAASGTVSVATTPGCAWSATSAVGWITITSGRSGTGNGTVSYSVQANTGTDPRSGTLTIAGRTFTVNQAGASCVYSISPAARNHGPGAETGSVSVMTSSACPWAAQSNSAWITITSGTSGSGNGTIAYAVAANTGAVNRTGTLTIAGQTFSVSQMRRDATLPDPAVTQLTAATAGVVGKMLTMSVTVTNLGVADAGPFRIGFYYSADASFSLDDVHSGWMCVQDGTLSAGQSFTCAGDIGIPASLAPGLYYLIAVADDASELVELNESNNAVAAQSGPITLSPSLAVYLKASRSSGPVALNGVDLTATVTGSATGSINYTFYCNRPDSGTDIRAGWVQKLDGEAAASKTVTAACNYSTPGTYTAKVIVERGSAAPAEARTNIVVGGNPEFGVTVITHGYILYLGGLPTWTQAMGAAILLRAGSGRLWVFDAGTDTIEDRTGSVLGGVSGFKASDEGEQVILVDWSAESNNLAPGFAEATAHAVYAMLMGGAAGKPGKPGHPSSFVKFNNGVRPIHFIGHSLGSVVNSEAIQRLGALVDPDTKVEQMTTLDPHDWDQPGLMLGAVELPDTEVPDVHVWNNVYYADNYFQTKGSVILNPRGRAIPGSQDLNIEQLKDFMDGSSYYPHVRVHTYYHGTVDPKTVGAVVDGQLVQPSWFSGIGLVQADQNGYAHSRIAGRNYRRAVRNCRINPSQPILPENCRSPEDSSKDAMIDEPPQLFLNGRLDQAGGLGDVPAFQTALVTEWPANSGKNVAALNYSQRLVVTHLTYIPEDATTLTFGLNRWILQPYGGDDLLRVYAQVVGEEGFRKDYLHADIPLSPTNAGFDTYSADVSRLRGQSCLISFELQGGSGAIGSNAYIDDISIGRSQEAHFVDVPDTYWAYDHIEAIYDARITTGCGGSSFCPEDTVTREQMAAFIIRSLQGNESANYCSTGSGFADVAPDNMFCGNIKRLSELGMTAVVGNFDPKGFVTRGQMAAFLIRTLYGESFSYTDTPYFDDVPVDHVFFKYVQKMKDLGMTKLSETYFVDRNVTRAEMAVFLARVFLGMN